MARLEDLQAGARVVGLAGDGVATVKTVQFVGDQAAEIIFTDAAGQLGQRIVYRDDEPRLKLAPGARPWSFDGDGELLRLVSEAYRIRLAWLFDPFVAITSSIIEPLPHQISAVYEEMLPRQPMRFLLADDPGAGKTVMAGLLIKELLIRGDLERCLIIAPGSLTEQWQDELQEKFGLDFELLTRDRIVAARDANPFKSTNLMIARLDQLSRNEDIQARFKDAPDWDLVVIDEAHRMSGHIVGDEVKYTKRYRLGQVVGSHCRNLLLMTATPHSGLEEDFQIFMALLDADRFEGRFRDGTHTSDTSDLMRRLVKEDLLRFDGRKLFPERKSYTPNYDLSPNELKLYAEVTSYVRDEMNRAERFGADEAARKVNVGFALMTLQRRLASSPEAIFKSIERRRERLEARLREERLLLRGQGTVVIRDDTPKMNEQDWDDVYEESPQEEREELEEKVVDNATAARTVQELETEIGRLKELEKLAKEVRYSDADAKWKELTSILNEPLMVDGRGNRRKLVIFTEFRDTLTYLAGKVRTLLGRTEAVVEIHGGVPRDDRRKFIHAFMNDPKVLVLIANDAAGEGVNLQRAHLMVNYDLPWNPNRLEQRFGRIHRIGQDQVCHLWNLVAKDTREGEVYHRLLEKLETERTALGGKVFDVLGQMFERKPLRELLVDAIRYGDDPARKDELNRVVEGAVDREHLQRLLDRRALVQDSMDTSRIQAIREEMDRANARRLQPHFIEQFFLEAFTRLGGKIHLREVGRFEITHVPQGIRERDRLIGRGAPVLKRYERVCFDKEKVDEQPRAYLVCPGSPLLDATIDLVIEQNAEVMKRGAVLIDEADAGIEARLLFYLEHAIQDGRRVRNGYQVVSQRLEFVEVGRDGTFREAGPAPYLNYRGAREDERQLVSAQLTDDWLCKDWDSQVLGFAIRSVVPEHVKTVRDQRLPLVDKTEQEVRARLLKEINFWDHRAEELKARERSGKPTRLPAQVATDRAEKLADRLKERLSRLQAERNISPRTPAVRGGALIIPAGLLAQLQGVPPEALSPADGDRERIELLAMKAVLDAEHALGRKPRDVSAQRGLGYDIESTDPSGGLVFIEVKGRISEADTVTLTRSEVLAALNSGEAFRLAVVRVAGDQVSAPVYVTSFDYGQPVFGQTSSTYRLDTILERGGSPR